MKIGSAERDDQLRQGNRMNGLSPMSRLLGLTRFAPLMSFAENYLPLMHTGKAMECVSGAGKRVKNGATPPPSLFCPLFHPNISRKTLRMNDLRL
jgi:hypothetical protein